MDADAVFFYFERMVEMTEEPKPEAETVEETAETEKVEAPSKEEFEKLQKALKEANKEAAARRKKLEELEAKEQERAKAEMSEVERLKAEAAELLEKNKQYQIAEARRTAAIEADLDLSLADRIVGETPEAMLEDAKRLAELLPKKTSKTKLPSANPGETTKGETDAERRKRLFG